jgi:HEAT repeat protein
MKKRREKKSSVKPAAKAVSQQAASVANAPAPVAAIRSETVAAVPPVPAPARQVETPAATPPAPEAETIACIERLRTGELASRVAAAARLGVLGGGDGVGALQAVLRDPTAEVAREAALALGQTGDARAVEPLAAVLENAGGYYHGIVRAAAAESLGQLKDRRSLTALVQGVWDPLAEPSRAAVRALAATAGAEAVPTLLTVVANPNGFFLPAVRLAAVQALAGIPTAEARAGLKTLAENPQEDAELRRAAGVAA